VSQRAGKGQGTLAEAIHYAIIATIIIQSFAGHLTCLGMMMMMMMTSAGGFQGTDPLPGGS
jgi:hypothetical protein